MQNGRDRLASHTTRSRKAGHPLPNLHGVLRPERPEPVRGKRRTANEFGSPLRPVSHSRCDTRQERTFERERPTRSDNCHSRTGFMRFTDTCQSLVRICTYFSKSNLAHPPVPGSDLFRCRGLDVGRLPIRLLRLRRRQGRKPKPEEVTGGIRFFRNAPEAT